MAFDDSCIFCKIVAKQAPSSILYEDELVMTFLDIRPLNMGHTLIIPKAHYVDIFDIPAKELAAVLLGCQTAFFCSKEGYRCRRYKYHSAEWQSRWTGCLPFACACGSTFRGTETAEFS